MEIIEEPSIALDVKLRLRLDGKEVKRVFLAPSREELPFAVGDGYLRVTLPKLVGYQMIVVEE